GILLHQAQKQGISYFNYGEAIAGDVPLTDKDRTQAENQHVQTKFSKSDLGAPVGCYPNDAYIGKNAITQDETWDSTPPAGAPPGAESRFDCFHNRFMTQLATSSVPAMNFMVLPSAHTQGLSPGKRTPHARVPQNHYALGQRAELITSAAPSE